jgi:hypothetical protein
MRAQRHRVASQPGRQPDCWEWSRQAVGGRGGGAVLPPAAAAALTDAHQRALIHLAKQEERRGEQAITVEFTPQASGSWRISTSSRPSDWIRSSRR